MLRGQRVDSHGCGDAVPIEHIQQTEDADPVAVLADGELRVVRSGQAGQPSAAPTQRIGIRRRFPLDMLEHDDRADREGAAAGPIEARTARQGRPVVVGVVHAVLVMGRAEFVGALTGCCGR